MTASADSSGPSFSVGDVAVASLEDLLQPLIAAATDEAAAAALFAAIGWRLDALPISIADVTAAVTGIAAAVSAIEAADDGSASGLSVITAVMQAATALPPVIASLGTLPTSAAPPADLANLPAELALWLLDNYLLQKHPVVRSLLAALTVYTPQERAPLQNAVVDASGNTLRDPYQIPELHFDQLGTVLSNPAAALRAAYFPGGNLVSQGAIDGLAGALFPVLADVLSALGLQAQTGIPDYYEIDFTNEETTGLNDTLTVWLSDSGPQVDDGTVTGLTFGIAAPDGTTNGRPAFFFAPQLATMTSGLDGWTLSLTINDTGTVDPSFWLVDWAATGADPAWPGITFTVTLQWGADPPTGAPATPVAPGLQLSVSLTASATGVTGSFDLSGYIGATLGADDLPDSFLQNVLPADAILINLVGALHGDAQGVRLTGSSANGATMEFQAGSPITLGPIVLSDFTITVAASATNILAGGTAGIALSIGPINASVNGLGAGATVTWPAGGGNAGPLNIAPAFVGPTSVALAIDAGPVGGGGMLLYDPAQGQYGGALQLELEVLSLAAIGLLNTKYPDGTPILNSDGSPGYSLLIIIAATFPPIQLGFGFSLTGIGGLLGLNRTMNTDAMRAGVRNRAIDNVLMPSDPVDNAAQIVNQLSNMFPVAMGRFIIGPMLEISWGVPPLIVLDIAVLIELPPPLVIAIIGRIRLMLPEDGDDAIVAINLDVLGILDFGAGTISIDATIYDSTIAGFTLSGDMALRANWKGSPQFALSVGGFNPSFTAPPNFPTLQRLTLSLCTGDNPRVRLEAYLAVTSNTVQCGARFDLHAEAAGFAIDGMLTFDALIEFSPFGLVVDLAGSLAVTYQGSVICSVSVAVHLTGPGPWQISGKASVSVLMLSATISFDATVGSGAPPAAPPAIDVAPLLAAAIGTAQNWTAQPPGAAGIGLRSIPPDNNVRAHPLAALTFRQRVAPLGVALDHFGSAPISGANEFTLTGVTLGSGAAATTTLVSDDFAAAQFETLTDAQKLSQPSFQSFTAGFTGAFPTANTDDDAAGDAQAFGYEVILIDSLATTAPAAANVPIGSVRVPQRTGGTRQFAAVGAGL